MHAPTFREAMIFFALGAATFLCFQQACQAQAASDHIFNFLPLRIGNERTQLERLRNEDSLKFQTKVIRKKGLVLVEFFLDTCPACSPVSQAVISSLNRYSGAVGYVRLNLNKNLGLSFRFDVPEVPAILVFKDGELIDRFVTFGIDDCPRLVGVLDKESSSKAALNDASAKNSAGHMSLNSSISPKPGLAATGKSF